MKNGLSTLIKMQIREKLNISHINKKQMFFKCVFSLFGFVAVAAIAYVVLYVCQFLNLFSITNHIPVNIMSVVLLFMFVINLISSMVTLSNSLYYSQDNQVLVTLPVNANLIFISKIIVHYITELKRTFSFLVPVFFAYGFISGLPVYYYLWMIIMFCMLAVITVLISGVISIPCALVLRLLNRYKVIKLIFSLAVYGLIGAGAFYLISKIPSDINLVSSWREVSIFIREFLSKFTRIFGFVYIFAIALCGDFDGFKLKFFTKYSYIVPLVMLALMAVLLGLNLILSRPIYLRAISASFEHNKNTKKQKSNVKHGSVLSTTLYEFKKIFRQTENLSGALSIIIIAPIAVLALNKIYGAINTRLFGDYLTIAFNVLIILLFTLSSNIVVSSIYSRDGDSFYTTKTVPKKPYQILFPRLIFNFLVSLLILTATTSIFFSFSVLPVGDKIMLFVSLVLIDLIHLFWTAEIDFLNLQTLAFRSFGKGNLNTNELKSTILSFAISLITFAFVAFFLMDNSKLVFIKLLLLVAAVLTLRVYLFSKKAKILFKEK